MKPRTYRRAVNSLTLAFDPLTWDGLKANARDRGESMERLAYLMIKAAVENKATADNAAVATSVHMDSLNLTDFAVFRGKPVPETAT